MKKLLSLFLAFALIVSLGGCTFDAGYEFDLPTDEAYFPVQTEATQPEDTDIPEATEPEYTESAETDPTETELTETEPEETEPEETEPAETEPEETEPYLDPYGSYTTKEDVALYIYLYGELPSNFMTKREARDLGWQGGSLEYYAPGMCIGGDYFGNYEGILPSAYGRVYTECDIDTLGAWSRGAKRIVFSNDGLIYYTDDHYETFELLYGEE